MSARYQWLGQTLPDPPFQFVGGLPNQTQHVKPPVTYENGEREGRMIPEALQGSGGSDQTPQEASFPPIYLNRKNQV